MAFYQRVGKLAFMPAAGGAAAVASTSFLLGGSRSTNQKVNQAATRQLTSFVNKTWNSSGVGLQHQQRRKFASIAKDVEGTAASSPVGASQVASSSNAAAKGGSSSKGFVQWYEGHLSARPVTTKAITGSILWGVGDVVAQVVPPFFFAEDDTTKDSKSSDTTAVVAKKEFKYDVPRTARAVIFGFAIHAPLSHVHYNFLEWMTVRAGFQGLSIPVFKTIMEQFVYWSWFSNSLYHGAMGAMQGMNLTQCYDRIADVLWDTQVAQWGFWIPVQLLNFQFVPVRHQLNVVLATSVVWTALLSAWYPPKSVEDEEKKE